MSPLALLHGQQWGTHTCGLLSTAPRRPAPQGGGAVVTNIPEKDSVKGNGDKERKHKKSKKEGNKKSTKKARLV